MDEPTFKGLAAPGAEVALVAIPRGSPDTIALGRTAADPSGRWTLTSRPLPDGSYRVYAKGVANADPKWPRVRVTPKASLGTITVDAD